MMTEDEALTKWCPMARVRYEFDRGAGSYNRIQAASTEVFMAPLADRCIASDCMMWRWNEYRDDRPKMLVKKGARERVSAGNPRNSEWVLENPDDPAPARTGLCGLAGRDGA